MSAEARIPLTSISPDADRLASLQTLFPEAFTEGKVDFERLKQALGESIQTDRERYGLNWAGKSDAIHVLQSLSVGTLQPQREESVNFDTTENLMIEGDNLEVLKLLQKSYFGKVKMIYIDPPYNTGNEFIYPDNFREGLEDYLKYSGQMTAEGTAATSNKETDGRYHSKWLSMMYPRLFLAMNLLRDDGVIFISIDDHEIHNLRLLMNEIFGEENFLAELVWEKTRKNDAKLFSIGHDYVLVYARSLLHLKEQRTVWREEKPGAREIITEYRRLKALFNDDYASIETALRQWYQALPNAHPAKKLSRYKWVDQYGPWRDRDISWPGGNGPRYEVLHPVTHLACAIPERGWIYSTPETMQRQIDLGLIEFREDHTKPPMRKAHLIPVPEELDADAEIDEDADEDDTEEENAEEEAIGLQVMPSVIYKQSQVAVKYLRKLMGGKYFNNPKDHEVIARFIRYCTGDNDLILDCFAGAGVTGEAVLELNKESGGHRKFILVQLPETTKKLKDNGSFSITPAYKAGYATIADITRERVRRVIRRMNDADAARLLPENDIMPDRGFKAFRLAASNFKIWEDEQQTDLDAIARQLELFADNLLPDATPENILFEILLKAGYDLNVSREAITLAGQSVQSVAGGALLVCLERRVDRDVLEAMIARKPTSVICLDEAFHGDDALLTNALLQMQDAGILFQTI